jgi:hypothetical protein
MPTRCRAFSSARERTRNVSIPQDDHRVAGYLLTWSSTAYLPDGHVSSLEWWALAGGLATASGVFAVANSPVATKP